MSMLHTTAMDLHKACPCDYATIVGLPTLDPTPTRYWRGSTTMVSALIGAGVATLLLINFGSPVGAFFIQPSVTQAPVMSHSGVNNLLRPLKAPVTGLMESNSVPQHASHGQPKTINSVPAAAAVVPSVFGVPNPYIAGVVAALLVFALQATAGRVNSALPPMISLPPAAPNVHSIWAAVEAAGHGDTLCVLDEHHGKPAFKATYSQMHTQITSLAGALQKIGVEHGMRIGLFSENSSRWLMFDQAAMMCGAVSAVRGAAAPIDELLYILEDSGSAVLVVETTDLLQNLIDAMTPQQAGELKAAIVLYEKDPSKLPPLQDKIQALAQKAEKPSQSPCVYHFTDLEAMGKECSYQEVKVLPSDLATLVYTSGTTGHPKGVMLTHSNLLTQIHGNTFHYPNEVNTSDPRPGDIFLSILPCWHVFERATEYWMFSHGITLVYTTKRRFKQDLATHQPHYLIAVPRIFDLIYTGVQQKMNDKSPFLRKVVAYLTDVCKQFLKARRILTDTELYTNIRFPDGAGLIRKTGALLTMILSFPLVKLADTLVWKKIREATGGRLKVACSGGASLPMYLEDFYEMAGLNIVVGYGLTETSPVIAARRLGRNIRGSCGPSMSCTLRVVDEQTGMPVPPLTPGVVRVKGQQVTAGYFRNPEATAKAFDKFGYFDTGDTGYLLKSGELVVSGRVKDIIVLSNGENIEPSPIEDAIMSSTLVDQVMLVGQGQRGLGALVVPNLTHLAAKGLITEADLALAEGLTAEGNTQGLAELADRLVSQPDLWKGIHKEINTQVKHRKGYRPEEQVVDFKLILTPFSVENQQMTQTLKVKRNVVEQHYDHLVGALFK